MMTREKEEAIHRSMGEILKAVDGPDVYAPKKPNGVQRVQQAQQQTPSELASRLQGSINAEIERIYSASAEAIDSMVNRLTNCKEGLRVKSQASQEGFTDFTTKVGQLYATLKEAEHLLDGIEKHL